MSADIIRAEEMKQRYLTEAVVTAGPAEVEGHRVVEHSQAGGRADDAFEAGDLKTVNDMLCHVQEILLALRGTLRTDLWEGAAHLTSLPESASY
jgi:flagellar protein FliS